MTKWQTSNALVKSQFSLYSFLWYHYIWHWYHIMNIFYHVIKHFLVDIFPAWTSKIYRVGYLDLFLLKTLIKTFRVDLHGTYHFNEISICFEMHINIYCYECCHWIGSLFLAWRFYCFERRICIRSVCFAVIHVLNTLCVYIKHPNVYA